MKPDFYETLGVKKGATAADIKAAYRKKSADAEEKFKEINEAYEVLSNDKKKTAYDQYGHAAFDPSAGGFGGRTYTDQSGPFTYTWSGGQNPFGGGTDFDFGGFSNPFDIFEQFFGGGGFGGGGRSRQVPTYKISLTFLEAAKGCEKEVSLDGKNKKIKIPAGVDDGQRIKFADFILFIDVLADPVFKREGNDLFINQEITIKQAILGDELQVPTLDNPLKIKVKAGTQSGTLVRLRGHGIKDINGYGQGDLYIRLNVVIPVSLNSKQRQLINDLEI
jgi:DnaJ-class molecular chaperone